MKITAILGTYHKDGIINSAVDAILAAAAKQGAEVHKVHLMECQIKFCGNCQLCQQEPGPQRGKCPVEDDLPDILDAIDSSDAIVLASPMNFGTVTALMKQFIERLGCYGYWPWNRLVPEARIKNKTKRAIIVASCAAPAVLGRYFTSMKKLLQSAAVLLGAGEVKTLFIGMARHTPTSILSDSARTRATKLGRKLAR